MISVVTLACPAMCCRAHCLVMGHSATRPIVFSKIASPPALSRAARRKTMNDHRAIEALRRRLATGGNNNRVAFSSSQIESIIERFGLPAALRSRAFTIPAYASRRASAFVTPPVEPEDKDRQFTFVISDPGVDRSNDTIAINGW